MSHSFGLRSPFLPTTNSGTPATTCFRRSTAQEKISKPDGLRKAKNHCERAMYDAAEAGIWYTLSSGDGAPVS